MATVKTGDTSITKVCSQHSPKGRLGDSWVVPKGASHSYKILEPFTAVEATLPPAHVHGRDET
jgi:hypothetical protein